MAAGGGHPVPGYVFRIAHAGNVGDREATPGYPRQEIDHRDGYIHMSTAPQLVHTATRYFHGATDLVVLVVDTTRLNPEHVRMDSVMLTGATEPEFFPHLYEDCIPWDAVVAIERLRWNEAVRDRSCRTEEWGSNGRMTGGYQRL